MKALTCQHTVRFADRDYADGERVVPKSAAERERLLAFSLQVGGAHVYPFREPTAAELAPPAAPTKPVVPSAPGDAVPFEQVIKQAKAQGVDTKGKSKKELMEALVLAELAANAGSGATPPATGDAPPPDGGEDAGTGGESTDGPQAGPQAGSQAAGQDADATRAPDSASTTADGPETATPADS